MAKESHGAHAVSTSNHKYSMQIEKSLSQAAKSLSERPQELRGPFVVKSVSNAQTNSNTKR